MTKLKTDSIFQDTDDDKTSNFGFALNYRRCSIYNLKKSIIFQDGFNRH